MWHQQPRHVVQHREHVKQKVWLAPGLSEGFIRSQRSMSGLQTMPISFIGFSLLLCFLADRCHWYNVPFRSLYNQRVIPPPGSRLKTSLQLLNREITIFPDPTSPPLGVSLLQDLDLDGVCVKILEAHRHFNAHLDMNKNTCKLKTTSFAHYGHLFLIIFL